MIDLSYWLKTHTENRTAFYREIAKLSEADRREVIHFITVSINRAWFAQNGMDGVPEEIPTPKIPTRPPCVEIDPDYQQEIRRAGRHIRLVTPLPACPVRPPKDEADFSDLFAEAV